MKENSSQCRSLSCLQNFLWKIKDQSDLQTKLFIGRSCCVYAIADAVDSLVSNKFIVWTSVSDQHSDKRKLRNKLIHSSFSTPPTSQHEFIFAFKNCAKLQNLHKHPKNQERDQPRKCLIITVIFELAKRAILAVLNAGRQSRVETI